MNPNKTLGSNFKGAVAYITHDVGQAETSDRVDFTYCHNHATTDPKKAALRMAWTAMHAEAIRETHFAEQGGAVRTGRKMEKPVLHISLNWHPHEKPTQEQMIEAGKSILERLQMGEHQAVFAAHSDKAHPHMHIVVNRIHPEKGTSPSLSNDKHIMQKWAYDYEKENGKVWCKEREAKYEDDPQLKQEAQERQKEARRRGKDKNDTKIAEEQNNAPQGKFRRNWEGQKNTVNPFSEKANQIRSHFAGEVQSLSAESKSMYASQKQEKSALYKNYEREKNKLWQERGKSVSDAYHAGKFDDNEEWHQLSKRHRSEYGQVMKNMRDLEKAAEERRGKSFGFFVKVVEVWYKLTAVDDLRERQQWEKKSLSEQQKKQREGKVNERKAYHKAKSDQARLLYSEKKKQLEQKHEFERKKIQERWKQLNDARTKAWQDLKAEQQKAYEDKLKQEEEQRKKKKASATYRKPTISELYNQTRGDQEREQRENLTSPNIPRRGDAPSPHNDMGLGQGRGGRKM